MYYFTEEDNKKRRVGQSPLYTKREGKNNENDYKIRIYKFYNKMY